MLDSTMHRASGVALGCFVPAFAHTVSTSELAPYCAGHHRAVEDTFPRGCCVQADMQVSPTTGKTLSEHRNQMIKESNSPNQHGARLHINVHITANLKGASSIPRCFGTSPQCELS